MTTVRIQTDETERIEVMILDDSLDPLTGKTDILISIRRVSDGFFYDFNDDTFKTSGWTTRQTAMSEVSATNAPGEYSYDFDTSAITNATADDTYQIRVDQSPGTDAANVPQTGEVKVGQWADQIDDIETDTQDIQARLPAALVGGRMDADVGNMQAGVVDAAAVATDAIDADALAADAVAEIVAAMNDLDAQEVRDAMKLAPTVGAPGVGSVDEHLDDILADTAAMQPLVDAAVSSRATQADILSDATPFPGANIDQALSTTESNIRGADGDDLKDISDEIAAIPAAPSAAAISTQVWSEALPGLFGAGTAGLILGTNLDALVSSRATQADILSDATPFAGANIDAAISSRAAPGDAMDLVTDALDAAALATSAMAELNTYLEVTASHGAGSWAAASVTPSAIATAVWQEALPGTFGVGEAGYILGTNLDALISSRSVAGDAMDLITDALDSGSLATTAIAEINNYLEVTASHGAGSWGAASSSAIATAVWSESVPGAFGAGEAGRILGDYLDATISSRAAPGNAMDLITDAVDAAALSSTAVLEIAQGVWGEPVPGTYGVGEAGKLVGDYLDAAISSRAVPGDAMDLVLDAVDANAWAASASAELNTYLEVTASHGAGAWTAATVSPAAIATAVWTEALPGAFGAGSAGFILGTNLDLAISSLNDLDIADVQTALTNQGYTAARAPNLDNLDAAITTRSSHSAADVDTQLSGVHGAGSWTGETAAAITAAVWGEAVPGAFGAGTAGFILGTNLDDQITDVLTAIAALNDIDQADVQAALTAQGYTAGRAPGLDNLDALISSRSSHSAADVDTQLSGVHGSGDWEGATVAAISAQVDADLTVAHGAGSWQSASVTPSAIAAAVWQEAFATYTTDTQMGYLVNKYLRALIEGDAKQDQVNKQWVVYDPDDGLDAGATELARHDTLDASGNPTNVHVYTRKKV